MISFTIVGKCPSGKNQVQRLWRNGKLDTYPNERFSRWVKDAGMQLIVRRVIPPTPITTPVALSCDYTPGDNITRDLPGLQDAIWFLIASVGILKDDGLVYDCHWKRRAVSKEPKLYVEIEEWKP